MRDQPKRFRNEPRMAADRLLAAYLKSAGISQTQLFRMNEEEFSEQRRNAEASGIPIPLTDDDHLYHGTSRRKLKAIADEGLQPDKKSGWTKEGFSLHVRRRVFFCDTVSKASFYASVASERSPAILRVRKDGMADMKEDRMDSEGCFFVERSVHPCDIEMWSGKAWKRLAEPEPEPEERTADEGMEP